MPKLDFAEIKRTTTFEKAASLLGLQLKRTKPNQFRGPCPCGKGDQRALCLTEGQGFYCWGTHASGSVLDFVMHVRQCTDREAAEFLTGTVGTVSTVQNVPESDSKKVAQRGGETQGFPPLAYLVSDHEAVTAVGFDKAFAQKHGIGFAPRGTMKDYVLIPFRDETGVLLGYVGVQDCKLPATFTPNVVSLEKKRA